MGQSRWRSDPAASPAGDRSTFPVEFRSWCSCFHLLTKRKYAHKGKKRQFVVIAGESLFADLFVRSFILSDPNPSDLRINVSGSRFPHSDYLFIRFLSDLPVPAPRPFRIRSSSREASRRTQSWIPSRPERAWGEPRVFIFLFYQVKCVRLRRNLLLCPLIEACCGEVAWFSVCLVALTGEFEEIHGFRLEFTKLEKIVFES